jgi:hypothetical protein
VKPTGQSQEVEQILNARPTEVAQITPNPREFAAKIRRPRNYYTHFRDDLTPATLEFGLEFGLASTRIFH